MQTPHDHGSDCGCASGAHAGKGMSRRTLLSGGAIGAAVAAVIVGEAADLIWNRGPAQATLQEMTSQAGDILQRLGRLVEPFKEDLENAKT